MRHILTCFPLIAFHFLNQKYITLLVVMCTQIVAFVNILWAITPFVTKMTASNAHVNEQCIASFFLSLSFLSNMHFLFLSPFSWLNKNYLPQIFYLIPDYFAVFKTLLYFTCLHKLKASEDHVIMNNEGSMTFFAP